MEQDNAAKVAFFKAFNKCQGALSPVKTDSENPHFHSKYASLAAVMDAVKPFIEAGFSFIHEGVVLNGKPYLRTSLVYGGYERVSDLPLVDDGNPQHLASSSTYIKRQAVTGLTGLVADDDDDGNAATKTAQGKAHDIPGNTITPRPTGQAAAQGGESVKFIPTRVEFVEGRGNGAGKTFSEIYSPNGDKYSGTERHGEIAASASEEGKQIIVAFKRNGKFLNTTNVSLATIAVKQEAETIEEVPF